MRNIQVFDYGLHDGIRTYRITGRKADLERIIQECQNADARFHFAPRIERYQHGQWTILLKLKLPMEVGERVD
jgi:hypothetical protein